MEKILKAAQVRRQALDAAELALINRQSLRELAAEEVFTFRLAACDNQVDRDFERFTDRALEGLAPLFVGRSVLMDHRWSAGSQTARVYGAAVEAEGPVRRLVLRCYMPRTEQTAGTITAIETGILRECSVGCLMRQAVCSVCGTNKAEKCCVHLPGKRYDGKLCVMDLDDPGDAYEVSLCAVPVQPGAGIIKSKRYGGLESPVDAPHPCAGPTGGARAEGLTHDSGTGDSTCNAGAEAPDDTLLLAMAIQEQEEKRYGGVFV